MTNNDILRRLRYAINLSDKDALTLFSSDPSNSVELSNDDWNARLRKQEEDDYVPCSDAELAAFLDGFIVSKRGLREPAPATNSNRLKDDERLSRNDVLKKLRIALNLREQEMLATLKLGGSDLSKSELGAFFRKPGHKHYRACGNQVLRNFIVGLTKQNRPA